MGHRFIIPSILVWYLWPFCFSLMYAHIRFKSYFKKNGLYTVPLNCGYPQVELLSLGQPQFWSDSSEWCQRNISPAPARLDGATISQVQRIGQLGKYSHGGIFCYFFFIMGVISLIHFTHKKYPIVSEINWPLFMSGGFAQNRRKYGCQAIFCVTFVPVDQPWRIEIRPQGERQL